MQRLNAAGIVPLLDPSTVPLSQRFTLIQLDGHKGSIGLALDVTSLNPIGYVSSANNHFWYFKDVPRSWLSAFTPGGVKTPLSFCSTYAELERAAGQSRDRIPLGRAPMIQAVSFLYNSNNLKKVAKALIVCIQMFAEAPRIAYIERNMTRLPLNYLDPQMISYERTWVLLSRAVQAGNGKKLDPPVRLVNAEGKPYTVTKVSQLKNELFLVLFHAA